MHKAGHDFLIIWQYVCEEESGGNFLVHLWWWPLAVTMGGLGFLGLVCGWILGPTRRDVFTLSFER